MGCILQQVDDNGNRFVVKYFSKKFTVCQIMTTTICDNRKSGNPKKIRDNVKLKLKHKYV